MTHIFEWQKRIMIMDQSRTIMKFVEIEIRSTVGLVTFTQKNVYEELLVVRDIKFDDMDSTVEIVLQN